MKATEIKRVKMSNGKTYTVSKIVGDSYQMICDGIVCHMSIEYVINEIANGRAVVE